MQSIALIVGLKWIMYMSGNVVRRVPVVEGMTIFMSSESAFLEANQQLNEAGFRTICNEEQWSIYIAYSPFYKE